MACEWEGCDRDPVTPNARFCQRCYQRWRAINPFKLVAPNRLCEFDDCERQAPGKAMHCKAHQRQARESGGRMWSLIAQTCPNCGVQVTRRTNGHKSYCSRCSLHRRVLRHGLTIEGFEAIGTLQRWRCAICDTQEPGGKGGLHFDHDHEHCPGTYGCALCFRGLLCHACNTGLGMFKDSAQLLETAARYLRSTAYQSRLWEAS